MTRRWTWASKIKNTRTTSRTRTGFEQQKTVTQFLRPSGTQRREKYLWLKAQHTVMSTFYSGKEGKKKELDQGVQHHAGQRVFVTAVRSQNNTERILLRLHGRNNKKLAWRCITTDNERFFVLRSRLGRQYASWFCLLYEAKAKLGTLFLATVSALEVIHSDSKKSRVWWIDNTTVPSMCVEFLAQKKKEKEKEKERKKLEQQVHWGEFSIQCASHRTLRSIKGEQFAHLAALSQRIIYFPAT